MNASIFWRVLWKEYRAQRTFWISMVVLTLLVELLLLMGPWHNQAERIGAMFFLALASAALYALGSGTTLFATEHEAGTYDFLRALPVKPLVVFAGKIVFALASTAALYLVAWTLALGLARGLPDPLFHRQIWVFCGLGGLELLVWGTLFSLLLKRPLVAAVLAGTFASINLSCFLAVDFYNKTIAVRLFILALVTVIDVALAARWYRERLLWPARASEAIRWAFVLEPTVPSMLGALLWQEFRQSVAMTAGLIIMLLPSVFFLWMEWMFEIRKESMSAGFVGGLATLVFGAALTVPLLGSSLFLADQTGCRFRFLAERGIPPRLVWLCRQIRGLIVILLGLLLVLPPAIGLIARHHPPDGMLVIEYLLGFVVVAYAGGQLCSMAIRSGIVAATVGTVLTFLLCWWARVMYIFGLSWLWSVAPLPLAFLLATWLHAPNWLLERKTWRAWLRPVLVIVVPALAILAAIPPVRVHQIPAVGPGFEADELNVPVPPEEKETLALYGRAIELQRQAVALGNTPADESARRTAEEQAVALALEASRRPLPGFYASAPDATPQPAAEIHLAELVLASAEPLQAEGKLDAALDRYVAAVRIAYHAGQRSRDFALGNELEIRACERLRQWAAQPGQKPQRVHEALRTIVEQWRDPPSCCDTLKHIYLRDLRVLKGDREDTKRYGPNYLVFKWFPWERARAVRLFNLRTAEQFARYRETQEELAVGRTVNSCSNADFLPVLPGDLSYGVATRDTVVEHIRNWLTVETQRRATRLILALEAWKLEHGGLPGSLQELRGKYLGQLPVDPYAGGPFRYEPKGLPNYLAWRRPNSRDGGSIEPGRPFVACDSWSMKQFEASFSRALGLPEGSAGDDFFGTEAEVWKGVWVFPIP
jgi:ABC-type transport system involved in multi-copper enzyme maturation permease subunit